MKAEKVFRNTAVFGAALLFAVPASWGMETVTEAFERCGVDGSVTVYDAANGVWFFSDEADARRETLPASTFKILNSLIALETGAVKDEKEIIPWDGRVRGFGGKPIDAWNRDTDMEAAFKNSTVWFYEELARRIGREHYRRILEAIGYGNGRLDAEGVNFWVEGPFGVSPAGQIEFLIKLRGETLPFSARTFEIVKRIMIAGTPQAGEVLRGKTGWTQAGGLDIGWWTGYLEKGDDVYYFAARLTKDVNRENPGFAACRREITEAALNEIRQIPVDRSKAPVS